MHRECPLTKLLVPPVHSFGQLQRRLHPNGTTCNAPDAGIAAPAQVFLQDTGLEGGS